MNEKVKIHKDSPGKSHNGISEKAVHSSVLVFLSTHTHTIINIIIIHRMEN